MYSIRARAVSPLHPSFFLFKYSVLTSAVSQALRVQSRSFLQTRFASSAAKQPTLKERLAQLIPAEIENVIKTIF